MALLQIPDTLACRRPQTYATTHSLNIWTLTSLAPPTPTFPVLLGLQGGHERSAQPFFSSKRSQSPSRPAPEQPSTHRIWRLHASIRVCVPSLQRGQREMRVIVSLFPLNPRVANKSGTVRAVEVFSPEELSSPPHRRLGAARRGRSEPFRINI